MVKIQRKINRRSSALNAPSVQNIKGKHIAEMA